MIRNHWRFISILVLIQFLAAVGVLASVQKDWEKALKANSILSFQKFLKKHGNSNFASEAESRLQQLIENDAFNKAVMSDSIVGYEDFIQRYPKSGSIEDIKKRLTSKISALQGLGIRTIYIEQESGGDVDLELAAPLREILVKLGLTIGESLDQGYDARLTLSRIHKGHLPGMASTFVANVEESTSRQMKGQLQEQLRSYAYSTVLTIYHSKVGLLYEKKLWGSETGDLFGLTGVDPDNPQAKKNREESFIDKVMSNIPVCLISYFGLKPTTNGFHWAIAELKSEDIRKYLIVIPILGAIGNQEAIPELISLLKKIDAVKTGYTDPIYNALEKITGQKLEKKVEEWAIWWETQKQRE